MRQAFSIGISLMFTAILTGSAALGGTMNSDKPMLTLTVVFNNVAFDARLKTSWGFSCLIEGKEQTILFDTGGDEHILIDNLKRLGIDPAMIDMVFLSHPHGDHTGGLWGILKRNPRITVWLTESFPASFKQAVSGYGASLKALNRPTRLFEGVHSGGERGDWIKEQALILETTQGLVIVTGCAHPGIVNVVKKATERFDRKAFLVLGGFHLMGMGTRQIEEIIEQLKRMGVKQVAPSHCTGDKAISLFRSAWGDGFLEGGAGAVIRLPSQ
jgi:7,8-dihydropterin-6-yl-methyl-4-(beta-D-ribofuranosyl)aminobenzene 5'-phosphate synthase